MNEVVFAVPGDIDLPTGGYVYDRRVLSLLPTFGLTTRHVALPGSFPAAGPDDLATTERLLAATHPDSTLLIDGLAFGAMPAAMITRIGRRIVALVHHPLSLETGLAPERAAVLAQSETAALALAHRVVCTSPTTARTLVADYAVPATKIVVAEPGTDPAHKASGTGMPMQLLAVGTVSARKNYPLLVRALVPFADVSWRLTIAGAVDRDPPALVALKDAIASSGLEDRIRLAGPVVPDTLAAFYDAADIFVMPSLFEGYGMVLAEAMAHGLPIVCTTGGAAAETVPDAAAIKVAPGDEGAFSAALGVLLRDRKVRRRLEQESWAAGRKLPTWHETVRRVFIALTGIGVDRIAGISAANAGAKS